jgi:amino acid efflux transporter
VSVACDRIALVGSERDARGIGALQGAALALGALIGTGIISLPALAAEAAGPASLVAWAALLVVSVGFAATAAAVWLLTGWGRAAAVVSVVASAGLVSVTGWRVLVPLAVGGLGVCWSHRRRRPVRTAGNG